jgi:hypothetical protein
MAMAGKLTPGSQAASIRGPVSAIGSPASAARHRICRVPGWAPGAQCPWGLPTVRPTAAGLREFHAAGAGR